MRIILKLPKPFIAWSFSQKGNLLKKSSLRFVSHEPATFEMHPIRITFELLKTRAAVRSPQTGSGNMIRGAHSSSRILKTSTLINAAIFPLIFFLSL